LAEMDYVPLAVLLLAQVSIGFSPRYMLNCWRETQQNLTLIGLIRPCFIMCKRIDFAKGL
jgi:hypothetical protein